ncbi:hypothetical protein M440DRAFT_1399036 [Trichoderma longibrachiatum ATCC 18648]|uniref:Secreted protein n=1 Tax=Trichoderma longibrachiatum ATCC 18648 TaxID=983965 RepID=A0A2T4CDX2_TRILO|nr:hypothetical protein M440DRAFT_1399036 [Trichoderma longibrachiatum ATCC 18648]
MLVLDLRTGWPLCWLLCLVLPGYVARRCAPTRTGAGLRQPKVPRFAGLVPVPVQALPAFCSGNLMSHYKGRQMEVLKDLSTGSSAH